MEITTGVHLIPGVTANVYLILESNGLALIDSGLPGSASKILKYIDSLGFGPEDIDHIIITHADEDHYGALAKLQFMTGASTYASLIEANAIQQGKSSRQLRLVGFKKFLFNFLRKFFHAKPAQITTKISENQILPFIGGLHVLATPGHTPGHISLYSPSQGILFAGDSMRSTGEYLTPSSGVNTWDEEEAIISVKKQSRLGARIVCVGHGPVIYEARTKFPELNNHRKDEKILV